MTTVRDWPLKRVLAVVADATPPNSIVDYLAKLQALASHVTLLLVRDTSIPDKAPIRDRQEYRRTIHAAFEVTVAGSRSDAIASIIETARDLDVDMIVAVAGSGEATSTSVVEDLAWHADMPVMMLRVGVSTHADVARIVVPVDGSAVSVTALPVAIAFSRQFAVPVHLLTVLDPGCALPPAYAYMPSSDPEFRDAVSSLQRQANHALNRAEVMVRAAGIAVSSELIFGPTGPCILSAIQDGDWVVMTTHGERKTSRCGSVAVGIAHEAPVPVVILHAPTSTGTPERVLASWDACATATVDGIRPGPGFAQL